ncbi:glycine--tRNA ligase, mitochondrial 1-like protein [Tanacetum coccineum]
MRHVRTDELGVPFAVVVDSTTSVTIRERDGNEKIKLAMEDVEDMVAVLFYYDSNEKRVNFDILYVERGKEQRLWEFINLKSKGPLVAAAAAAGAFGIECVKCEWLPVLYNAKYKNLISSWL